MTHSPIWRVMTYMSAILFMAFFAFIPPAQALAANSAPEITSEPITSISADNLYRYAITATDSDNDSLTLSLTTAPEGMLLQNNIITWQPTKDGVYNVVLQASDGNNGYDNQSWQITVSLGAVDSLAITPNDRPTLVGLGNNKQFSAEAFDQYNNQITNAEITWSTIDEFGSIDQQGMFTAKKGGVTSVIATSGNAEAIIGVIVEDARATQTTTNTETANTNSGETASTGSTKVNNDSPEEPAVKGDETLLEAGTTESEEVSEETTADDNCSNFSTPIVWLIIIIYALAMATYFKFERKNKSGSWWIFPLLMTIIGIIIYYKNFCPGTFVWWPWVLIIIGFIITANYKLRKRNSYSDNSQTELPF